LLSARAPSRTDNVLLFTRSQFGGFGGVIGGGVGFAIPAFGSTGFATGGFGGGAPAGIPGPVLTLESAFGTGFTAADIADQIRAAEQGGRFSSGEGGITITTGPSGLVLVLNLANALFEIFDASGRKLGGGVTPEAALEAVRAGGGVPAAGGGGGTEPLPFPRRSGQSRPLPLSHLRRSPHPSGKTSSVRSRRSSQSCNLDEPRRRGDFQRYRQPSPLNQCCRVEQSTSPSSSDRRAIPPEYVVRVFQIRTSSIERSRSGDSSRYCKGFGKQDRTRTSSAEHLSNSLPQGCNN